jgi:hypothetical protein
VSGGRCSEPAGAFWAVLICAALLADAALIRAGRTTLSSWARATPARRAAVCACAAHLLGLLPRPLDPFTRAGAWAARR